MEDDNNGRAELQKLHDNNIDQSELKKLHENNMQQLNQYYLRQNTNEVVEILGGIENILLNHLSANHALSTQDLQSLHDIMSTAKSKRNRISTEKSEIQFPNYANLTYYFAENDTLFHFMFRDALATKMIHYLFNSVSVLSMMIIFIICWVLPNVISFSNDVWIVICLVFVWIIPIWLILLMFSFNRKAIKLILATFEFWIKCTYILVHFVASFLYYYFWTDRFGETKENRRELVLYLSGALIAIMAIICFSSFDAMNGHFWVKKIASIAACAYFTYYSLDWTFFVDYDNFDSSYKISGAHHLSLTSIAASSIRVVTIFLWKQTILSLIRRKKCVLIKYTPYFKYVNHK